MKSKSARGDVYSAGCPSRVALELIGSKWALLIVPLLDAGPVRNGEFMRKIDGISQKMLTQTLRILQRDGLVARTVHPTVPPAVSYRLTAMGESLLDPFGALVAWADANHTAVISSRKAFDADAA
jgi:DNA-binding HxlR family transcriptional regulator